jgi:hypothetical protein
MMLNCPAYKSAHRARPRSSSTAPAADRTVDGETVSITESGRRVAALLVTAREEILNEFLEGWAPQDHPDVAALVRGMLPG